MCEVESIVYGRPITKVSDDPRDLSALTPNHLLLLRAGGRGGGGGAGEQGGGGYVEKKKLGTLKRRQLYLSNVLWSRWVKAHTFHHYSSISSGMSHRKTSR